MVGFGVFWGGIGIVDVWVGQGDDLLGVGRIGEDFLVVGYGGVEYYFVNGLIVGIDGFIVKNVVVGKCKYGWFS